MDFSFMALPVIDKYCYHLNIYLKVLLPSLTAAGTAPAQLSPLPLK